MQIKKLVLVAAVICTPALAQPGAPDMTPTLPGVPGTEVICVHQEAPTGSRIGAKKLCHTADQWREIHAQSAQDLANLQTRTDNSYQRSGN